MSKILVFGHANPDTDAITSAISFAYLQNQLGFVTEAVALGEPNEETQYVLDYFGFKAPRVIEKATSESKQVMLVDHNEFQQSVSDIADVEILAVIDHHRIDNFHTANPLFYRAEPVGCTNTIVYKLYQENKVEIPQDLAGLMLSAIISDTLLFKSPTCTDQDIAAAKALAEIANVQYEEYGLDMLKAGTNLSTKTASELVDLDAKSFPMGDNITVRIAQVNTVDTDELLKRQVELEQVMLEQNEKQAYDLFLLIVTNILTSDSVLLAVGNHKEIVEKAFHVKLDHNCALLKGVVSRKKQVVPNLTEAFK